MANTLPNVYASHREWGVEEAVTFSRYCALSRNWSHTTRVISDIRETLTRADQSKMTGIQTLAVAGSLGRMEAGSGVSDCDLIIILDDEALEGGPKDNTHPLYKQVWEILSPLNLETPKKTGTFSQPTSIEKLCDKQSCGAPDEDMRSLAKRLLLLLETQPVYRPDQYENVIEKVIDSYAHNYVAKDPRKEWGFLINDLVRYFRALCVNYQWDFSKEHGKWPLRNVKLRHSRLIMYGGLLMLLGECSRIRTDKVTWLKERLKLTPLERIALAYTENNDTNFFRLAGFYNTFLEMLNRKEIREALNGEHVKEGSYDTRYQNPEYSTLKANSDGLVAELVRFVLGRRGVWSERFFEYLIF